MTDEALPGSAASKSGKRPRRYPFLPSRLQGGDFMVWLRRLHAWIGVWGAIVGVVIGITGITLNHRAEIQASQWNAVDEFQLEVPAEGFADKAELDSYLKDSFGFHSESIPIAAGGAQAGSSASAIRTRFQSTRERYDFSWIPGNRFATATHVVSNPLSTMNSLHLGRRGGILWVLVLDAFAGSLIFLALTGILMWSRMHGPVLLAVGLSGSVLAGAFYYAAVV